MSDPTVTTPGVNTSTPPSLDALDLSADHRARLAASAVSPAVAAARGYRTIPDTPAGRSELERLGFGPYQRKVPALLIPCYGVSGNIAIYQIRPDKPRLGKAKSDGSRKAIKYETPGGSRMVLDVPRAAHPQIADPSIPLWVTEGARKADAAVSHGLCCVALLGVDNWKGTNEEGGKAALACWHSVALNGRDVYVAFDSDVMEKAEVAKALVRFRAFLVSREARVHLVYLPPAAGGAKVGLDDYFAAGGTADALRALATQKIRGAQPSIFDPPESLNVVQAPTAPAPSSSGVGSSNGATTATSATTGKPASKPAIIVSTDVAKMADTVETALVSAAAFLFQQNGRVVEPARLGQRATSGAPTDAPVGIVEVRLDRMTDIASQYLAWLKPNDEGELKASRPDKDTLRAVLARPLPRFRYLRGVVMAPCLRADGTVLSTPGYDSESGLLFADSRTKYPTIPASPSLEDAKRAHATLCDVFCNFPFVKPCDKAAILSSLLTLLARHAIDGPVPLAVVRSPTPGTGKSLLVDIVSTIATGRGASRYVQAGDPEAERKLLFAIANDGEQLALFDNIAKPFGSAAIDATLTSMSVADRVMGTNSTKRVPFTAQLFATGNNIQLKGDLCRRVIVIDLDAEMERPEEARTFRHPDILAHVRGTRAELVAAALTILRAFVVAGRPRDPDLKLIGSFEGWDRLVRGALCWVSGWSTVTPEGDPAEGRSRIREDGDPEIDALRELMEAWRDAFGVTEERGGEKVRTSKPTTAAAAVQHAKEITRSSIYPYAEIVDATRLRLKYALAGLDPKLDVERLDHKRIGYALRKYKGRIVEGMRIDGVKGEDGVGWILTIKAPATAIVRASSEAQDSSSVEVKNATADKSDRHDSNSNCNNAITTNPDDPDDHSPLPHTRTHTHAPAHHARAPEAEGKSIVSRQEPQLSVDSAVTYEADDQESASSGTQTPYSDRVSQKHSIQITLYPHDDAGREEYFAERSALAEEGAGARAGATAGAEGGGAAAEAS